MKLIDADKLYKIKYHPLPYSHIIPTDAEPDSYMRGWNDAIDAIVAEEPTIDQDGCEFVLLENCSNDGVYCLNCHKKIFKNDLSNTMKWKDFKFCPKCGKRVKGIITT